MNQADSNPTRGSPRSEASRNLWFRFDICAGPFLPHFATTSDSEASEECEKYAKRIRTLPETAHTVEGRNPRFQYNLPEYQKELKWYVAGDRIAFQNLFCFSGLLNFTFGFHVADVNVETYQYFEYELGEWLDSD